MQNLNLKFTHLKNKTGTKEVAKIAKGKREHWP